MIDIRAAEWYRALNLQERASLRTAVAPVETIDTELAKFRLERWQSQAPFSSDPLLARRLASDGLSITQLFQMLGEPAEVLKNSSEVPPDWIKEFSAACEGSDTTAATLPWPETPADPRKDFLRSIRPLLDKGRSSLLQGARSIASRASEPGFDPEEIDALFTPILVRHLVMMISPVMVLEMHVAGMTQTLTGDTLQENFGTFIARLQEPEIALSIFQEYPVLARQIVLRIDQWVRFALEFLEQLAADHQDIRTLFAPQQSLGKLTALTGGLGDRHQGGRSVLMADFGSGIRLIYKPRSLAVDRHFQELLGWLNERADRSWFRTLKILDRDSHGWLEFVEPKDCDDAAQVAAFFERQGAYLALLNTLQATDFHYENLIAAGEHPILVDLEALFHPSLGGSRGSGGDKVARRALSSSVLRVGLLPQRMFSHSGFEGVDVSGLGAREGQLSPQAVPLWEKAGTQEMRLVRRRVEMPAGNHRPTLKGLPVDVGPYLPAVQRGFEATYALILAYRQELLAPGGPLSWFEHDSIRVIIRPTRTYALLLQESFHPDLLRDGLDRDRHFDRLWIDVPYRPELERVIPFEREALAHGDVPLFTSTPASCSVFIRPGQVLADFFETPGVELARIRLRELGTTDLARQVWFLRASLSTLAGDEVHAPAPGTWAGAGGPISSPPELDRDRLLSAARQMGNQIEAMVIKDGDEIGWTGLRRMSGRFFGIVPLATDLYDGLPGVALFLAYLGRLAEEPRYTVLARTALTTLRRQLERSGSDLRLVGGFEGWGGIVYLLTHLGILWDEPELLDEAERMLTRLPDLVTRDEALDVVDGAAGCTAALLGLLQVRPSKQVRALAIQCGERLLAKSQEQPHGIGWPTRLSSRAPLTGFAHGVAGISWALLSLASRTGDERFYTAGRRGFEYERSLFAPDAGNWPDLRILEGQEEQERCTAAWCFGAAGIGLSRLACLPYLDDTAILKAEIRTATATTLRQGFGFNHSLCHGDLGNLEFLVRAGLELNDPDLESAGRRMAASILDDLSQRGPRCATPAYVESPGLMTGLAGIGYGLLRLAFPQAVPSVLLLESPRESC